METKNPPSSAHVNPVYPGYFADPAVLRASSGVYYAYGTGHGPETDGRQFPVLRSEDFVHWQYVGGALPPLAPDGGEPFTAYWAPEVTERDGKFYMYYSAARGGRDETHRLRVAIADQPQGPFKDAGRVTLLGELADVFSIDAHPFRDPVSGKYFLFFATDFFTDRVGTGTAAAPLADDMTSAAGPAVTVLRAGSDWQVYERNRPLYGKVWPAWHTVEGPFVWAHPDPLTEKVRYYCFYSGGNWQTPAYGVGYGVADSPLGPYRDEWNFQGPSVLRGIEGKILGPGLNSITLGPDGREYLVYHAWDPARTARRMFIDPLFWENDPAGGPPRPRCDGPTIGDASQ